MYTKHALTIDEQIDQLSRRGLIIDEDAVHFLSHISYYRLACYWWPMQKDLKISISSKPKVDFQM